MAEAEPTAPTSAKGWVMVPPGHPWDAVHSTHSLWITAGMAWCNRCGKYSSSKRTLQYACVGEADTGSRGSLNTLRNGRHPNPKAKKWPDGEPADEAQQAVRLHLATYGADDIEEEAMRPQEVSSEEAMREGSEAIEYGTPAQASSGPAERRQASQEAGH